MSAQDDFDLFSKVAEMLGLEDDESSNFLTSAMQRRGHKPRVQWDDGDGNDNESGGDFFSARRKSSGGNSGGGNRERKVNKGWQYGT